MKKIKSDSGYLGHRYICIKCHGEVNFSDKYCKWCGKKLTKKE